MNDGRIRARRAVSAQKSVETVGRETLRERRRPFLSRVSTLVVGLLVLGLGACSEEPLGTEIREAKLDVAPVANAVSVSNIVAASGYEYVKGTAGLANGSRAYIDRTYTYQNVPSALQGQTYIRTRQGDMTIAYNSSLLSFRIDREATVYVAYNGENIPGWIRTRGFASTGQTLVIAKSGERETFYLYAKTFPAGTVTLGSNLPGTKGAEMYTVIVRATTTEAVAPPATATGFAAVVNGIRLRGFGQGSYALRQPATGRTQYFVSTTGSDSNPGTSSAPFRTINKAAQVAVAGDVVTIRSGTYSGSVRVRNAGTAARPIVFQAAQRGQVILTGGSYNFAPAAWHGGMKQNGAIHVTLRGLTFRNYARTADGDGSDPESDNRAAVGAIRGWRIEDCLFDRAGYSGLDIRGDSVTVVRSTFQYHHTLALTAVGTRSQPLRATTVSDVVLRGNNTRSDALYGEVSTKVVKFYLTANSLVDNVESYENNGPGWWFDTNNTNYTIRNSYLHDNRGTSGRGIFIEISWAGGVIENNVIARNAVAGLTLANSQGIRVTGNLFVANPNSMHLINHSRGSAYPLRNISITGNSFKGWQKASGLHPGGDQIKSTTPAQMNISVDRNVYDPGASSELTYWPHTGWIRSIADMRNKLGWEPNGRIADVYSPI